MGQSVCDGGCELRSHGRAEKVEAQLSFRTGAATEGLEMGHVLDVTLIYGGETDRLARHRIEDALVAKDENRLVETELVLEKARAAGSLSLEGGLRGLLLSSCTRRGDGRGLGREWGSGES